MTNVLSIYVVFNRDTSDFPGLYVCRKQEIHPGEVIPTDTFFTGSSLEDIRSQLPPDLNVIPRSPQDDPNIIESWL